MVCFFRSGFCGREATGGSTKNTTGMQNFTGILCRLNEKRCAWSLAHSRTPIMAAVMIVTHIYNSKRWKGTITKLY